MVEPHNGGTAPQLIDGRVIVRDGELTTLELPRLVERHNALARNLANAVHSAR